MRLVADRYLKMATNLEDDYGCNTTKDTFMLRYILTVTASSVAEVGKQKCAVCFVLLY